MAIETKKVASSKKTVVKATAAKSGAAVKKVIAATNKAPLKKEVTKKVIKKIDAPKKVAVKKVVPKKVVLKKVTEKIATPKKTVLKKVTEKIATPKKVAVKKVTEKIATPKKVAVKKVAEKIAAPKKVVVKKVAEIKAVATKVPVKKVAAKKVTLEKIQKPNAVVSKVVKVEPATKSLVKKTVKTKDVAAIPVKVAVVVKANNSAKETKPEEVVSKKSSIKSASKIKSVAIGSLKKGVVLKGPTPLVKPLYPRYFFNTDIPEQYNENYLRALPRDPEWIFVYWEFTSEKIDALKKLIGADLFVSGKRILRLHDITDGAIGSRYYDVEINDYADNWYIKVPEAARTYMIQCGILIRDGRFIEILSSNVFSVPRSVVSDITDEEWLTVNTDELIRVSSEPFVKSLGGSENLHLAAKKEAGEIDTSLELLGASELLGGASDLYSGASESLVN